MTFECMRCGRTFEPVGFESTGTFYTLCKECGEEVLNEVRLRKMETEVNERKSEREDICEEDFEETEGEYVNRHTIGREVTIREIGLLRERFHIANATGRMVEG